ncbi:MAG: YrdB family protein [Planctomycetes bacterium]|nr:YrdB family protein [Planctomycetota bacterium]
MPDETPPAIAMWNLALRFLLEVAGVVAAGAWGWQLVDSWARWLLAFGLPAVLMTVWATFNVRNDPSRSGKAPVPVPGAVRLLLELAILGFGAYAAATAWSIWAGGVYGALVAFQYATSWKRVAWLVRR